MQTYKEPVPLKYRKLAIKYPDIFYSVARLSRNVAGESATLVAALPPFISCYSSSPFLALAACLPHGLS